MLVGAQNGLELGGVAEGPKLRKAGFTPATATFDTAGLKAWIDTSDAAYRTVSNGRIVGVQDKWVDRQATAPSESQAPTLYTATMNGKDAAYFDFGGQRLDLSYVASALSGDVPFLISIAFRTNNFGNNQCYFGAKGADGSNLYAGAAGYSWTVQVNGVATYCEQRNVGPHVLSLYRDSGRNLTVLMNGQGISGTTGAPNVNLDTAWMGMDPRGGINAASWIPEMLVYTNSLPADHIGYLYNKYGGVSYF